MTQLDFLKTFDAFPKNIRLELAKKIEIRIQDLLFEELDDELPNVKMSIEEIQAEINANRSEKKQKYKGNT